MIHKIGDPSLFENFRPITLEQVSLKVFTSLLRNRVFTYLINKSVTWKPLPKVFLSGMSGTFEHITEMDHIINHSRKHQRRVTVTLIDLKSAFGEVFHSLIQSVPWHHYIQDETNCVSEILFSDFRLSIITNDFHIKYVVVEKGVLQDNSFSP